MTNGKVTILYFSHLHPRAERSSGIGSTIDSRALAFASEAKVTPEGNRILAIVARPSVVQVSPRYLDRERTEKYVGGLYSHAEEARSGGLSCVSTGFLRDAGCCPPQSSGGDGARKRGRAIYFRLPVPSRSGMIYAERVPRLRAAGEFSLSAPQPAVSPGWRSVPLCAFVSSSSPSFRPFCIVAMHLSRMTCNYRPSLFFSLSPLRSFAERSRGRAG